MTDTVQAMREARHRWGKTAGLKQADHCTLQTMKNGSQMCLEHNGNCPGGRPVRKVGHVVLGAFFMVEGSGENWAEAFRNVDTKKADDKKRCDAIALERAARGGR